MTQEASPSPTLPTRCDVLVVGAGPAGSACARMLARAGVAVVLADQSAFPRDKTCGDGLIPDAYAALRRLGVLDEVMRHAKPVSHVGCIAPSGQRIDVPGTMAVLPRRTLDHILCRAAVEAGALLLPPARFEAPLEDDAGKVVGARLRVGEATHELRADWVILATGAVPQALIAAGMCERRTPSGVALRGYVHYPALSERMRTLDVVWHPRLKPGYGWIFPCPDGLINIGVGIASSHQVSGDGRHRMRDINLRKVFHSFVKLHKPARELVERGTWYADGAPCAEPMLKGAPLRCSLNGARWSRPGLIVTGEAAGSTYAFTGEGIGKAMETAIHAAQAIVEGRAGERDEAAVRAAYEARLEELRPRFSMYEKANRVNAYPWLADILIWSAKRSPRRLARMAGVLDETHIPTDAVTMRGVLRAIFVRN
jgi:geranylgeranyl reductase family protein